jgi:ribulose-bisphosphate carboxylase large chain
MAHPGGPTAGVASIRQAWDAVQRGEALDVAAKANAELKLALAFFGGAIG